jgi:hypothetical protein
MGIQVDLTGQRFGRLLVIGRADDYVSPKGRKGKQWQCACDCGNEVIVTTSNLHGKTCSCGCLHSEKIYTDISGLNFGRLTVIKREKSNERGDAMWLCRCICGSEKILRGASLRNGSIVSCGCYSREECLPKGWGANKTHGMSETRLYNIWLGMRSRTSQKTDKRHKKDYWDRGIRTCEEWKNSFESFRDWALKNGYTDDLTIDRVDNDGDYEPLNCRFVKPSEQSLNRRSNRDVTYNGITQTISQWAKDCGLPYDTLRDRINRYGWSVEKALTEPVKK